MGVSCLHGNGGYHLFFLIYFLILLIHLEQGMGKVSPSTLIMVKCRTEVIQKKIRKWETASPERSGGLASMNDIPQAVQDDL